MSMSCPSLWLIGCCGSLTIMRPSLSRGPGLSNIVPLSRELGIGDKCGKHPIYNYRFLELYPGPSKFHLGISPREISSYVPSSKIKNLSYNSDKCLNTYLGVILPLVELVLWTRAAHSLVIQVALRATQHVLRRVHTGVALRRGVICFFTNNF